MIQALKKTALYCRLSKDDDSEGDSASIKTQKAMLTQYAQEHGLTVTEIYVDDGYSGLNFERPSFNRMLDDIENGKIDIVITKDAYVKYGLKFFEDFLNGVITRIIHSVPFYVDGTLLPFYETL